MGHKLNSESGMSLLQVLLAIGISVMMGVFVLQTVLQMKKVEVLMNLSSEAQDIEVGIQRVLMSSQACGNTLYGPMQSTPPGVGLLTEDKVKTGVPIWGIYTEKFDFTNLAANVPAFKPGQLFANDKLKIKSMRLIRKRPGDTDPTDWAGKVATIYLEVLIEKNYLTPTAAPTPKLPDTPGGQFMVRRLPLLVHVNSSGQIESCTSLASLDLANQVCSDLGGTMNGPLCDLQNSPAVKKVVCDTFGMTWVSGNSCN